MASTILLEREPKRLFDFYASMRRQGKFVRDDKYFLWSVFGHEEARWVLSEPSLFSSDLRAVVWPRINPDSIFESLSIKDPPEHTFLREGVRQCFAAQFVYSYEEALRSYAEEKLINWKETGGDFVPHVIRPTTLAAILTLLGVPEEDWQEFWRWWEPFAHGRNRHHNRGLILRQTPYREQTAGSPRWDDDVEAYFKHLIEKKFRSPDNDLISAIVSIQNEGHPITLVQALNYVKLMLVSSQDATIFLVTNALSCLVEFPEVREQILADFNLIDSLLQETARFLSPIQGISRVATRCLQIGEATVQEGQEIIVWLGSANRDETVFPRADEFDLHRGSKHLLSYGVGVHYCLGAFMARTVAKIIVMKLLENCPMFRRSEGRSPEFCKNPFLLGFDLLPLDHN